MRFTPFFLCGLCVLISLPSEAQAEETQIYAILSQQGVWDSNPLKRTTNVKDIYGGTTSARLNLKKESDTTQADVSATVRQSLFNETGFNSTDFYARARLSHHTEKWDLAFQGNFDYDTTRTSEVTNTVLNIGSVRHTNYKLAPEATYTLSGLSRVSLKGEMETSRYDSDAYTDSTSYALTPSYIRLFTPLTRGLFSVRFSRYEADETHGEKVSSVSPSLGFSSRLTPTTIWNGHVGMQSSKKTGTYVTDTDWAWHYVYGTSFAFKTETDNITLEASRARQSQSGGSYDLVTSLSLKGQHIINKTLSASTSLLYQEVDYEEDESGNMETKWAGSVDLSYKVTPSVDLKTSYQYDYETLTQQSDKVHRHRAMLTLAYHPYLGSVSW